MPGSVTPGLVAVLTVVGISGSAGGLDCILLPAMALFAALAVHAIVRRRQHSRMSN
jgi:hypothetical protein